MPRISITAFHPNSACTLRWRFSNRIQRSGRPSGMTRAVVSERRLEEAAPADILKGGGVGCGEGERVHHLLDAYRVHDRRGVVDVADAQGVAELVGEHQGEVPRVVELEYGDLAPAVLALVKLAWGAVEVVEGAGGAVVGVDDRVTRLGELTHPTAQLLEGHAIRLELVTARLELAALALQARRLRGRGAAPIVGLAHLEAVRLRSLLELGVRVPVVAGPAVVHGPPVLIGAAHRGKRGLGLAHRPAQARAGLGGLLAFVVDQAHHQLTRGSVGEELAAERALPEALRLPQRSQHLLGADPEARVDGAEAVGDERAARGLTLA